jgi:hypothetical protein
MKKLRIFRRADAPDLSATGMMAPPVMDPTPPDSLLAEIQSVTGGAGYVNKVLWHDPAGNGMSLVWLWYAPHYALPRHSHDTDCVYYVIAGEARLGSQVVAAGDGFFVPSGAPYAYAAGPEGVEVLEFRSTSSFDIRISESLARWAHMLEASREHGPSWEAATPAHR